MSKEPRCPLEAGKHKLDNNGDTMGQRLELTNEEELCLTVQHLAIQNMHLTNAAQDFQRKLHILQLKMQSIDQDRSLAQQDHESSLVQIEMMKSARDEDCLKIQSLTARLNMIAETSEQDDAETQTDDPVGMAPIYEVSVNGDVVHYETLDASGTEIDHVLRNDTDRKKFKEEMKNRREARHRAIDAVSSELERLRGELSAERLARRKVEEQLEQHTCTSDGSVEKEALLKKLELVEQELAKENVRNKTVLLESKRLENENEDLSNRFKEESMKYEAKEEYSERRIGALKEVALLSKQMLSIREAQVSDLKCKLEHLQANLGGSEDSSAIRAQLELHVQNTDKLKAVYEDRMKNIMEEKEKLVKESKEKSEELEEALHKCSSLELRLVGMETNDSEREEVNRSLQTQLDIACEERNSLSNEIALINSLFTQMLVANGSTDMDLDKLAKMLQENHELITEMTSKEDGCNTASGLPKLLLDLINQIDHEEANLASTSVISESSKELFSENVPQCDTTNTEVSCKDSNTEKDKLVYDECSLGLGVEEIASNLPKVWRILMELLSHHKVPPPAEECMASCYKCIDTPSGPRFVPSVSNTYIRLKDLILEKKSLQKDLGKLKQLNSHLESKLQEQEKRLSFVSAELKKTWGVVGKLRSQYKQLHTHEQILRYELQQKRHLLTELKTELEYCREKWERAREMNNKTEIEWKQLRKEFAERKVQDRNNSGESGFSDEREHESSEEEEKKSPHALTQNTSTDVESKEIQNTGELVETDLSQVHQPETHSSITLNDPPWKFDTVPLQLMDSLKHQLQLCSKHLESHRIMGTENIEERQALDSIFSLPPIQIPCRSNLESDCTSSDMITTDSIVRNKDAYIGAATHSNEKGYQEVSGIKGDSLSSNLKLLADSKCDGKPAVASSSTLKECGDNVSRDALGRTAEEALAARAARLKRLEEQAQLLFNKVTRTTNLGLALNNRLEELHEQYGVPTPPPLPQSLPSIRIPVTPTNTEQSISDIITVPEFTEPTSEQPTPTDSEKAEQI